ncbi:hypothetical protein [Limnobacter alexandrii]|jgi:hypothetical protein|uniref:hypothetical protein n=1 Tax=Limnobacter alexandrii TaxID=2570352 RepID=UPI001108D720|nr:hypothetical protein [Limnobacter alexandrii]
MLKRACLSIALTAGALMASPAFAERFPDVPRPIDYFVNGEEILAVHTLRDNIRAQGNFPLAKALLTIGREDLLGLNRSLDSFETGTLETPLGGHFEVDKEEVVQFRSERAVRGTRGLNRLGYRSGFN